MIFGSEKLNCTAISKEAIDIVYMACLFPLASGVAASWLVESIAILL